MKIKIICLVLFLPLSFITASAQQTGVITGRVVGDGGEGIPNIPVAIFQINPGGGSPLAARRSMTTTDEDGNFRFTDLESHYYTVNALQTKGYTIQHVTMNERQRGRYYRVGDNVVIVLVKGGVITGRVTTADGAPMVGVWVIPTMVRDVEGRPVRQSGGGRQRLTDDRGIYRLFGLAPGSYIVSTRGSGVSNQPAYEGYVATYHPSSTRDTATEIAVGAGSEVAGADIRYRGERGYVISGTVSGGGEPSNPYSSSSVSLISVASGLNAGIGSTRPGDGSGGFAIYGVTDGEYEIAARRGGFANEDGFASAPRRVTVKGADVTGVDLKLAPLATISGRVVIESSQNACEDKGKAAIAETMVSIRRDEKNSLPPAFQFVSFESAVNDKGEFTIRHLAAGHYRIGPLLPSKNWYIKSITAPVAAPNRRPGAAARTYGVIDVARPGVALKPGDKLAGINVTVSEGAAAILGKIVAERAEREGSTLPGRLRVHLVPSERASADDVLRYAESIARRDGTFSFENITPGKYWLVARVAPDDEPVDRPAAPVAWDNVERAKLRKEAEAKQTEIELKACQRVGDQILKY